MLALISELALSCLHRRAIRDGSGTKLRRVPTFASICLNRCRYCERYPFVTAVDFPSLSVLETMVYRTNGEGESHYCGQTAKENWQGF